ncbi:MAG: ABC transporter substrate-binding protein [Dehalococcoidia bacterium]
MSNRTLTLMMGIVAALILGVGVLFVVALAGGGGGNGGGPASTDRDGGDDGGDTGGGSVAGICSGDTFYTFGSDPATVLDPIQVRDEGTAHYIVEIFGGLVTLDPELNVIGDIAESWDILDGGRRYIFHLRNNVVFHSGRLVTAEDVKYSLERAADPANNSPTVTLYLGEIKGLREKFDGVASEISGIRVIDDFTLEIELTEPIGHFLQALTYPVAFVVDRQQIEQDPRNWTRRPVGTGPFILKSFKPAEEIVLHRNDRYHLGVPWLKEVVISLGGGSLLTRYENDELHVGLVPALELDAIRAGQSRLADEYVPRPLMALSYLGLNHNQPPFDDLNVRKALAMALDRDIINEVLLFNAWRVADGILPPEMPGYAEDVAGIPYDPDEAKRLFESSRYAANFPRIVLTYAGSGGDTPDILQVYQQQWQDVLGIQVELQAVEYSQFLRELRRGTFQMYAAGWIADYADPEDFIAKLFESDSPQNELGYVNPEVDRLIAEARVETDQERRFALYHQAEQIVLDDVAVIPTYWPVAHELVKSCVKNWPVTPMTIPKYRYLELEASRD